MPYSLIGIDIGSRLTKVIEIKPGHHSVLMNAVIFATPYSKDKGTAKHIDEEQALSQIVNNIGLNRLRDSQIGITIPSSFIRAEVFILPQMSTQELNLAAINEAKRKMIPVLSPEKAVFDYTLLGRRIVEEISQLEVLVARCEKEEVEKQVGFFEKRGIPLDLIAAAPFAMVNLLPEDSWKAGENLAFVNIGVSTVDIFIARDRKVRFFRNVAFGVNDIISSISQALGVSWESALQRLYEYGVPPLSDFSAKDRVTVAEEIMRQKYEAAAQGRQIGKEIASLELKTVLHPHIERIVTELRRSFIYYKEQEKAEGVVERIFFSGGGSLIKNLVPEISKHVGGICSILNPFQYVKPPQKREIPKEILIQGSSFSVACGLALSLRIKEKERINFLPLPLKKRREMSIFRISTILAAGLSFFLFLVGYVNLFYTAHSIKLSLLEQKARIEGLAPLVDQEIKLRQLSKRIRGILTAIESLERESVPFGQLLIQLAYRVPKELTLNSVHFQKKKDQAGRWEMEMNGFITADYETACRILENFKANLKEANSFKNISSSSLELEPVTPFAVEGKEVVLTEVKKREFNLTADLEVTSTK